MSYALYCRESGYCLPIKCVPAGTQAKLRKTHPEIPGAGKMASGLGTDFILRGPRFDSSTNMVGHKHL